MGLKTLLSIITRSPGSYDRFSWAHNYYEKQHGVCFGLGSTGLRLGRTGCAFTRKQHLSKWYEKLLNRETSHHDCGCPKKAKTGPSPVLAASKILASVELRERIVILLINFIWPSSIWILERKSILFQCTYLMYYFRHSYPKNS